MPIRQAITPIIILFILSACTGGDTNFDEMDIQVPDTETLVDSGAIVPVTDATSDLPSVPDTSQDFQTPKDTGSENCESGSGCFGEACLENQDCQSGICALHQGDYLCSKPCVDECPEGWACRGDTADEQRCIQTTGSKSIWE